MADPAPQPFGAYIRLMREVRGLSQEELAKQCTLASDTIRRLEHGTFSPSLLTFRKVAKGFGVSVTQLFQGFDGQDDSDEIHELAALVRGRGRPIIASIVAITRSFLRALDEHDPALRQPPDLPPP
jgi:transcriptional regulator with XRE-family HTH domain